jgi:hypothetical protein
MEQGPERHDNSGVNFEAEMRQAQAAGERDRTVHWQAAMAEPGVGSLAGGSDVVTQPNYGSGLNPDSPGAPVYAAGEGYAHIAPDAPAQTDGRPSYAAPVVGDEDPFLGAP